MQNPQYSQNPEHPEASGTQPQDSRVQTPQNPPEHSTATPQNPPDPRMERAQFLNSRNHYAVHNHIFVSGIGEDWCEGYLDVEEDVTNVYGMPHGGTYFSLADVLAGMVLRANGYNFVTQSASCHYMRSTKEKRMYARAEIMKRGRGTAVIQVRVTDSTGKLLFFSTFDYFNAEGRVHIQGDPAEGQPLYNQSK